MLESHAVMKAVSIHTGDAGAEIKELGLGIRSHGNWCCL